MKNLIKILLIAVLFFSCENKPVKVEQIQSKPTTSAVFLSIGYRTIEIKEFEYKGRAYIYDRVRDGIAFAHAGHCSCNKKNK